MTRILLKSCTGMYQPRNELNIGYAAAMTSTIRIIKRFIPDAKFTSVVQFSKAFADKNGIKVIENEKTLQ